MGFFDDIEPVQQAPAAPEGSADANPGPAPASGGKYFADIEPEEFRDGTRRRDALSTVASNFSDGLTFGLDKQLTDPKAVKRQRKRDAKERPWATNISYGAGALASSLIPTTWIARLGTVGKAANMALPNVNISRSLAQGATRSTLLREGAKIGAKTAGLTAVGDTSWPDRPFSDSVANIAGQSAIGAVAGAPLNWVGTRAGTAIGERVGGLIERARNAAARAPDPVRAARTGVVSGLDADGVTPDDLRRTFRAEANRTRQRLPVPDDEAEAVLGGFMARVGGGMDEAQAIREVAAEYAQTPGYQALGLRGADTPRQHVSRIINSYRSKNAIPSTLTEGAALASGGDANNTFRRFALTMNREGANANEALSFMRARQAEIPETIEGALLARNRGIDDATDLVNMQRQGANSNYDPIYQSFRQRGDGQRALQDTLDNAIQSTRARLILEGGDDASLATIRELERFRRPVIEMDGQPPIMLDPDGNPLAYLENGVPMRDASGAIVPVQGVDIDAAQATPRTISDLEAFASQRRALQSKIDAAYRGGDSALGAKLKDAKRAIDNAVAGLNDPDVQAWTQANSLRHYAGNTQRAFESGLRFPLKTTSSTAAVNASMLRREFRGLTDAGHRQAFRDGLVAQLEGKLSSQGDGHDTAKLFNNRQTREAIREILGDQQADYLEALARRAGLATKSFNANKGSQTTPLRETETDLSVDERLAQATNQGLSLGGLVREGFENQARQSATLRNEELARILGANTNDPATLFQILRELEDHQRYLRNIQTARQAPAFGGAPTYAVPFATRDIDE